MPYFEKEGQLQQKTLDMERASRSLREELEAVGYYQERIDVTKDEELKKILAHNRDEEKEHAAMLIEWMRKNDAVFNKEFSEHDKV
ncbi:MAG: ferritin [Patescibacteria group bacterium]